MTKSLLQQVMIKTNKTEKPAFDVDGMIQVIEKGYVVDRVEKFQQKKSFAPSSITYNEGNGVCARYWYLAFEGNIFEDFSTPSGVANMDSGTASHERIQLAMQKSGILKDSEFKIVLDNPPIYGYVDALLEWNGEDIVGEIKTTNNDAFEYRKKVGRPKIDHVEQILIYMKLLGKPKGLVIYENKNNHELLLFPIEVNDTYRKWIDNTFSWMQEVRKAWTDRQLPIKTYRSNSKVCKTCPVRKACDAAGDGTIKITPLEGLSEIV
jgi:CRISPR/Cas system-associated exonuclease Cas4 (RecB family)